MSEVLGHGSAKSPFDVVIVGAGVAGLAAARVLAEAGLRICVLEARDAVGGRVRTERYGTWPIELGAEFVHGRPSDLLALIAEAGLTCIERTGSQVSVSGGELSSDGESDDTMSAPLERLRAYRGPDLSFREWLDLHAAEFPDDAGAAALGYVEGFNAADAAIISVRSLGAQQTAEDAIDGDRVAHIAEGYGRLPEFLADAVRRAGGDIRLATPVRAVHWGVGRVAVEIGKGEVVAQRAVLTLPLGVLQARTVAIVPEPAAVLAAASRMRMGEVCRFTLVLRRPLWQELPPQPAMRELSFLFSPERMPPVWWTAHPENVCTLTGWVGGPRAAELLALSAEALRDRVVRELAGVLSQKDQDVRAEVVACRTCDWSADPFARGAYSYVAVDGEDASERMSVPVEHTLFFAGEHTDTTGHWGTVHGALRSGRRAAAQVIAASGHRSRRKAGL